MAFVLAVIGLVGAPVATVLAVWARRRSLRAPEGAGTRIPDVYDLAYLAAGPERAAVALIALAGACGAAGTAWSAATGQVPGAVVGGIVVLLAVGGWWLSGRPPRVPVTDAGHQVLVATYTHYRRGGMADMAGHGVALRGADAIADPELRARLGALEAARSGGWNWDPAASPQDVLTPAGYKPMISG